MPMMASSRLASSNTMFGDLPPSSRMQGTINSAAALPTSRPVWVPPVKAIMFTPGLWISALPTRGPPVTTFTIPAGMLVAFGNGLAVVAGLQFDQHVAVLVDQVGEPVQQPGALVRRHVAPGRRLDRAAGGAHCVVDVLLGGMRHHGGHGAVRGIDRI